MGLSKEEHRMKKKEEATAERISTRRYSSLEGRIANVQSESARSYLQNRFIPCIYRLEKTETECRRKYYLLAHTQIVMGGLIPVLAGLADMVAVKIVITALATGVTGINALQNVVKYREQYVSASEVKQKLLRIVYGYLQDAGDFLDEANSGEKDIMLVNRCEEAILKAEV